VYFAAYWRFVERAEMDMFGKLGFPYESVFQEYGFWLPRVRCEVEYHAPALMNDELLLRTHIEKVGASSIRWKTVVFNQRTGEAGAAFVLTVACIDGTSLRSRPLPDAIRSALLPHVAAQA
jgi:YbgC/YbaW family acyl-CoA thioester hydrolase